MWAIDLGTTNTGVARWDAVEGRPRMVELANVCRRPGGEDHLEAPLLVPSATHALEVTDFWGKLGRFPPIQRRFFWGRRALIGREALELNEGQPKACFAPSFKQHLLKSPLRTLARLGKDALSARDISRLFVRELLFQIKESTGEHPRELVVTTPVDAYEGYRAEVSSIFRSFGVRKVRFLDEPVAAALGYGLGQKQRRIVLVVDFGGGTLDVALVALSPKGIREGNAEVLGKEGRPIGGNVVDRWLLDSFARRLGYPLPEGEGVEPFWLRMMLAETTRVKEAMFFKESELFLPTPPDELHVFDERIRGESQTLTVHRDEVIEVLKQNRLYEMLDECVDGAFVQAKESGVRPQDVEDVLMVGGSNLLPGVYRAFEGRFGRDAVRAWQPFEAVAYGAAVYSADAAQPSDFIVHDYAFVTHDIQTHEKQYSVIVPRGTRFPTPIDFWKRQLVPTCSLGEPETMFKLVICEVGRDYDGDRRFAWDADGRLHKLGGRSNGAPPAAALVVPLNDSNPTLGYLKPAHPPEDKRPRLEIAFGVNDERWLCATVLDLRTKRYMMREEPVVRLL